MNWTGGSLQRTKHANKGVLQKQKAYFAKTRTHLQNGLPSTAVPFKPSYALQDETNLTQDQHTGNSTLLNRDSKGRAHLLQDHASVDAPSHLHHPRDSATRDRQRVRTALSHDEPAPLRSRERELTDRRRLAHKEVSTNTEIELLEARRRQLLKKRDWIGVAPSQPLVPSFFASKDRTKIGKRRRVRGIHGATLRPQNGAELAARPSGPMGDQDSGAVLRMRNAGYLDNLRIRIGTDALTTVASTLPSEPNQSLASSESMLFDQQSQDAEPRAATQSAISIASSPGAVEQSRAVENVCTRPRSHLTNEQLPHDDIARAKVHGKLLRPHRSRKHMVQSRGGGMLDEREESASKHQDPQFQITQYVEGVSQPFRLVFDSSHSFGDDRIHDDSIREAESGGTSCASDAAHADGPKKKNMHEHGGTTETQFESEAVAASAIVDVDVDEALWKSVLDLAEQSSSHTRASMTTGTSAVHTHHKARGHEVESCSCSQHATQGDQSRIGSPLISASLPSLKREAQLNTNVQGAKNVERRNLRTSTMLDQEEQLWQNFVFDSGEGPSSGDGLDRGSGNIQRWKPFSGVPLSVAVSSVSNTPFRARQVPRTLDSVRDTAMLAPLSGSRTIPSSAATAGFVDKVCDGEGERSASTRRPVTHSSLLNNASGETNLSNSGMSGRTETSRGGLEQTDRSRDSLLVHDAGSGPRRFLHGSPNPDDWQLDLVDPNRIL